MEELIKKQAKEISISAVVRRVGKCPRRNEAISHDIGAKGCKCYIEDLGQISYWNKNPIKSFFINLFKTRK